MGFDEPSIYSFFDENQKLHQTAVSLCGCFYRNHYIRSNFSFCFFFFRIDSYTCCCMQTNLKYIFCALAQSHRTLKRIKRTKQLGRH